MNYVQVKAQCVGGTASLALMVGYRPKFSQDVAKLAK